MEPLPSLNDDDGPMEEVNQEPQLPSPHPPAQGHPLANNNSMGAHQEQHPLPNHSMGGAYDQEQHPWRNHSMGAYPMDAYLVQYPQASNSMGASQVLQPPLADHPVPASNHQQARAPITAEYLATLLHRSMLPGPSFPLFPGPSTQPVHGLKHIMAASEALGYDATLHPNEEDLMYFLAGRVRPQPGLLIYKCSACGEEFANRHAFGGHMSFHSKKNNSKGKSAGCKKKDASSSGKKKDK